MPPGYGHNGIAVGDDCITCSVGFRAPSHSEILREYTDHVSEDISDALRYNDADLVEQNNTGEISKQAINKVQRILRKYIEDTNSVSNWFGRYITTSKYPQSNDILPNASNDASNTLYSLEKVTKHFTTGGKLIRNESSRFAYIAKDSNHILFVDGECISSLDDVNELIESLCSEIELNNELFSHTDNNMTLLLELLQRGALYIPEA